MRGSSLSSFRDPRLIVLYRPEESSVDSCPSPNYRDDRDEIKSSQELVDNDVTSCYDRSMETITAIIMAIISLFGMADDPKDGSDTCRDPFVREAILCEDDYPCGEVLARLDTEDCWFDPASAPRR